MSKNDQIEAHVDMWRESGADLPERDPLRQLQRKLVVTEPPGAIFFSDDA